MIWFSCKQCGKVHGRAENSAGTLVFCDCGQGNTVPWESTAAEPEEPGAGGKERGGTGGPGSGGHARIAGGAQAGALVLPSGHRAATPASAAWTQAPCAPPAAATPSRSEFLPQP